jgi:hypothetical protein
MASKRKPTPEPGGSSYTPDPRQKTLDGLPSQVPQVVPDEVRYADLLERYRKKPQRAPPGQTVFAGIGLAGSSLEGVRLADPRAQMGLFGAAAPAPAPSPERSEPPPSSASRRGPGSRGRRVQTPTAQAPTAQAPVSHPPSSKKRRGG